MQVAKSKLDYSSSCDEYSLKHALYIYEQGYSNSLCIKHTAKKNGELGLGVPVDTDALASLFSDVKSPLAKTEFNSEYLLEESSQHAIWWSPRQRRRMFFRIQNKPTILNVIYPSLIWGVVKKSRSLLLAAIANTRPDFNSPLYHAPLMNISGNFSVCQGSAQIPDINLMTKETIKQVEKCIFDSNFSHVNNGRTLKSRKEVTTLDQLNYWKAKAKDKSIPRLSELSQAGYVSDFVSKVSR